MIRGIADIIRENIEYFPRVFRFSLWSIKKQNKGSDLGYLWLFIKPMMYVMMFYVAIALGLKNAKDIQGMVCPYIIWLATGLFAWFYMQTNAVGNAKCFIKNKFIIKKSDLPVSVIPTISMMSGLVIHICLVIILLVIAMLFAVKPDVHWLQIPLYTIAMLYFTYVWVLLTGLLTAVSEDFSNVLNSIRPAFFWLSGIFFNSRTAEGTKQLFYYFNPISFSVEGYRNSVCFNIWIWEEPLRFKCYLITMLVLTVLAVLLYRRVRRSLPEFI